MAPGAVARPSVCEVATQPEDKLGLAACCNQTAAVVIFILLLLQESSPTVFFLFFFAERFFLFQLVDDLKFPNWCDKLL